MIVRRDRKDYGWYEAYLWAAEAPAPPTGTQGAVQPAIVDSAVLAYFEWVGLDVETTREELAERVNRERAELRALPSESGATLVR